MKILFVQPGVYEVNNEYPPIGISYLASATRNEGHTVDIYDAASVGCSLTSALEFAIDFQPDVLCLSLYTIGLVEQYKFIKRVKKAIPWVTILAGGPHATALSIHTMKECSEIDFLVFGEGEHTIVELFKAIEGKMKPISLNGICYRNNGEVVQNEPRELINNLDEIPFPAFELLKKNGFRYSRRSFNLTDNVGVIMSSRGCPFNCAFCFKATFGNRLRRRSPQNVVNEMQWQIKEFSVKEFQFLDDLFAVNSNWLNKFFDELNNQNLKVPWKCLSRVNSVNEEDFRNMHKHGCYGIEFGIESGNDQVLKDANKGITTVQIRKAFKTAKKIGFLTFGFFIFGLIKDTHKTIKQTLKFAKEIRPDLCGFAVLLPFPGTQIYSQLPEDLRFKWEKFNSYYDKQALPFSLCSVSPHDLRKYAQQADAEVSGTLPYLFKNVVFRKEIFSAHRKEAFMKWYNSLSSLVIKDIEGERDFIDGGKMRGFVYFITDSIILVLVYVFFILPGKFLKMFKNY
jgi:anaerobic magnesium-protoporphyrin IX monomethyl ester cyclase